MLQIILEKPDLKVLDVRTQVFVENLLNRSVRFDVLATDSTGARINVEIQRSDQGAGKRRARYNCNMLDSSLLEKGKNFDELPETYVIFITEHDVLGKDKPLYHIGRYIFDTNEIFDDGSHIVYVNGAYRGEKPIGKLMHDFSCTNPSDMYYKTLADRARFFKESKEGILIMCKVMEDMRREAFEEGQIEGERKGQRKSAINIAKKMLADSTLTLEKIAEYAGLPLEEIRKLKTNL